MFSESRNLARVIAATTAASLPMRVYLGLCQKPVHNNLGSTCDARRMCQAAGQFSLIVRTMFSLLIIVEIIKWQKIESEIDESPLDGKKKQ